MNEVLWDIDVVCIGKYRVSLLWFPRALQLYRIENQHPPGHPMTAANVRDYSKKRRNVLRKSRRIRWKTLVCLTSVTCNCGSVDMSLHVVIGP